MLLQSNSSVLLYIADIQVVMDAHKSKLNAFVRIRLNAAHVVRCIVF